MKVPLTKKRLREIRKLWRGDMQSGDWKKLMERIGDFLEEKGEHQRETFEPYNPDLLKLVVVDFISK
ncbi:MAG: hypothetical protein HF982_01090 [Desulfobacteraceae bacterium]|nr:hypothetical protein [Desulfobacteraceae bacterium]MBC2718194.1 hypothetical protein [Desulfobacteraceae bacterium]